ncbi:MAG: transcription antitermination factor NusB [Pseudomonadota bacterium]
MTAAGTPSPDAKPVSVRHQARRAVVQALYQWQATAQDPDDIARQFIQNNDAPRMDKKLFRELFLGTVGEVQSLDESLAPHLSRPMAQVDPVERSILRLAAFELTRRMEIPIGVVLNEAVELAKTFGAEASHKFVNGVLDQLTDQVRPEATIVKAARKPRR